MTKNFYGLPTITLENAYLRMDALSQAGPRIVRLFLHGVSENLFAELPGLKIDTPLGQYSMQGGHRLWHSPEAMPRTYSLDDHGVRVTELEGGLKLTGPVEPETHMQKTIEIQFFPDRAGLHIVHTLTNTGPWAVEAACWGITQLPLGGIAVLPQPKKSEDMDMLLPNRNLVLWPYSRWSDARLRLHDDFILIKGEPEVPALKVGYANNSGWVGFLRKNVFFLKRYDPAPLLPHPDYGCSTEVYVNHLFHEVESLGPLVKLQPGQSASHTETWEIFGGLEDFPQTLTGVRTLIKHLAID